MKEHPILFSDSMVKAILEGRKTQTRRIVKPQPEWPEEVTHTRVNGLVWPIGGLGQQCGFPLSKFPFGQPGDRLWVRECFIPKASGIIYRADFIPLEAAGLGGLYGGWKPSIHMPRWASRITLEITDIRVEQLIGISESDALAEGVDIDGPVGYIPALQNMGWARYQFANLWESINSKLGSGWDDNPWVWVIEFKQIGKEEG